MAEFEFDGRTIRVIPPRELTLGDLAFIKQEFDIDGLLAVEEGLGNQEPSAWRALLIASIRQVQPNVSPTHGGIDHIGIQELTETMNRETLEWLEAKAVEDAKRDEGGARPTGEDSSTPVKRGARK